jgi:hypothetical protein
MFMRVFLLILVLFSLLGCKKNNYSTPEIKINSLISVGFYDLTFSVTPILDGGSEIIELGLEYSTDLSFNNLLRKPGLNNLTNQNISIVGLNSGNFYYVRAYIKNKAGLSAISNTFFVRTSNIDGTPSIITQDINSVNLYSAECRSTIFSIGNSSIIQSGVCYSLTTSPDITDSVVYTNYLNPGDFISSVNNLTPGTTYFVRSFAKNSTGICYGNELSFTTLFPQLPSVQTNSISSITSNSIVAFGSLTEIGTSQVNNRGFCWSTSPNPDLNNDHSSNGTSLGDFSHNITNLTPNTTYYIRSYATNNEGTKFGNQLTATTLPPPPVLISTNNCSSLNGINSSYTYWTGTAYTTTPWLVFNNGFLNDYIKADNPSLSGGDALGGHIEFQNTFTNDGFIKLWIKTPNPGYNNIIPQLYVDGILQVTPQIVGGSVSSFDWAQIKTSDISAGTHTIKLLWPQVSQYYYYSVDEIEFWEYP